MSPGSGHKVLLVDDDEAVVTFIESYLELHGFNVTSFSESVIALNYFDAHRDEFDLVISDQTMPVMTGIEMAKAMLSLRPDLPIILMTGYSEEVDERSAKALGLAEFLMKPFSINELLQAVRAHL
jgi:CheY-like chemotaxis protein